MCDDEHEDRKTGFRRIAPQVLGNNPFIAPIMKAACIGITKWHQATLLDLWLAITLIEYADYRARMRVYTVPLPL